MEQQRVRVKALTSFNHGAHDAKRDDVIEVSAADAEELYKRKLVERVPNEPAPEQGKDGSGVISHGPIVTPENKVSPPHENK